jgi:hypothetical protein
VSAYVFDGCLIASKHGLCLPAASSLQPTAVEAIERVIAGRPSGIPPAEASRVDR